MTPEAQLITPLTSKDVNVDLPNLDFPADVTLAPGAATECDVQRLHAALGLEAR